jgi:hypothetical protein
MRARWRAKFLAIFTVIMFLFCLAATRYFSGWQVVGHGGWGDAGPKILFFGLLTLVNAPFDWLSLGLTRFLLRYGIQLGGLWPYALAVVDAVVASALITLLALAMVWLTDLFNYLAEQGGGEKAPILPPMPFYLGMLHKQPFAPEFWWAYATLFSTMIPSVINLSIAGFSFLRGFPPARKFLLSHMREGETMPVITRLIAATILTAQGAAAWTLAIVAQIVLTYVVLWHAMPRLGLGILDLVEKLTF